MDDTLKNVCLEIAATANGDPLALMATAGRIRLICGWHYGARGLPLAQAEYAAELLIAQVLTETEDIRSSQGVRQ